MYKFILVETLKKDKLEGFGGRKREMLYEQNTYENRYYRLVTLTKTDKEDGYSYTTYSVISIDGGRFKPEIYMRTSIIDEELKGVEIQTTSYGALDLDSIETVIEWLNIAKETAKELEKFIK